MASFDDKMRALKVYSIFGEPLVPVDVGPVFAAIEAELGRALPVEYEEFVQKYGQCGFEQYVCCPVEQRFPLGKTCLVSVFFGLRSDKHYFLIKERNTFRGRIPNHLLPIANDPGSNLFVLSAGAQDWGKVYYWDHDHVGPDGSLYRVADSFGEFIEALHPCDPD